ncbi:unnamed protein product [Coregonus sp. 'balchen']|nr:unnamed protein product [Coregonus sp. 'balchen']
MAFLCKVVVVVVVGPWRFVYCAAECQPGFFKAFVSSDACKLCPANTQLLASGALLCPCAEGFYRAHDDPATGPCSGLPSAPRELVAMTTQLAAGKLQLSWSPPEDTGGRSDITYSVECRCCEGVACQPCGEKVRLEPASFGLTHTWVAVSELEPHLNYTFTVEAHSGVTSMRLDERSPTSLSLSWAVAPRRPLPRPTRYELSYRKKDDNLDVTTYTVLILEKSSVQISDLSPGTAYLFRVKALSPEGSPGESIEDEFETLPDVPQTNTAVIFGAAVGGAAMLFIVVVVLFVHKRRRNSHTRQGPEDTYFSSSEQLKPLKTYVDPHTYEDPNTAILKFASEIQPSHVTKQKVIGAVKHAMIVMKAINEAFRLPAPMDCPSAVYQLMLQCWLQDRSKRPRFPDIVSLLDKLLRSPESLKAIADFDPHVSIRLPSTSGSDGSPFRSVSEWLESIKMSQYSENFTCAGVFTMDQVLQMKNEDIKNIGVRLPGHLKRIAYSILGLKDQTSTLSVFAV